MKCRVFSINKLSHPEEQIPQTAADSSIHSLESRSAVAAPPQATENGTPASTAQATTLAPSEVTPVEKIKPAAPTAANPPSQPNYSATAPSAGKPVELLIEAKKEIVIEYAKGNSTQFTSIRMQPQTFQIIRSQAGLHLRTPDGSALVITVNGVLKGSAANSATPTVLSY